jgi:hypothetical protein
MRQQGMRAVLILVAALMFGLAGGYPWSELSAPRPHIHVPKAINPPAPPVVESAADEQWSARAVDENSVAPAKADPADANAAADHP